MSTWFHNDPAGGRLGPFTTEGLLERYRNRVIQGDTLVWREGWTDGLPLERAMADVDRVLGPQPPPLPPPMPIAPPAMGQAGAHRHHPAAQTRAPVPPQATYAAPPRKKGMSGCLIALIVVAVLAVPMIGILAAIALPAYRDYTIKAKVFQSIAQTRPLQDAIIAHVQRTGSCPGPGDDSLQDLSRFTSAQITAIQIGTRADGACVYGMTLPSAAQDGGPAQVVMALAAANGGLQFEFDCQASTVAERYRPATCRTLSEDAP